MPRYDPETIAALAEGRLDPEEAAALEREIAADPVAAAELAAQRLALEALTAIPRPELTPSERTELRAAVADAIGIAVAEPAPASTQRAVPWGSLGIAAAALAAIVAIVPATGLLSTGGDDAADLDLAAEAPTTAATIEEELPAAPVTDEAAPAEAPIVGGADANDGLVTGEDATAEASAFASTTTVSGTAATDSAATRSASTTEVTPTAPGLDEEALGGLTADLEALKNDQAAVFALAGEAIEEDACWVEDTQIRGDPTPQRFRFEYQNEQVTVIVYFEVDEGVSGPFQVWGVPDCADLIVIP